MVYVIISIMRMKLLVKKWLGGFFKRHPNLSITTPQGISKARIKGFTPVNKFFDLLEPQMQKIYHNPTRIYNVDESGKLERLLLQKEGYWWLSFFVWTQLVDLFLHYWFGPEKTWKLSWCVHRGVSSNRLDSTTHFYLLATTLHSIY